MKIIEKSTDFHAIRKNKRIILNSIHNHLVSHIMFNDALMLLPCLMAMAGLT